MDDRWCSPGTRVIVENGQSSFHGDRGQVIRTLSRRGPGRLARLVLVRLDDPAFDVEFQGDELRPEP